MILRDNAESRKSPDEQSFGAEVGVEAGNKNNQHAKDSQQTPSQHNQSEPVTTSTTGAGKAAQSNSVDSAKHNPPRCETCRYFVEKEDDDAGSRCHRYPPQGNVNGDDIDWNFAMVLPGDFCGEHAPVHHDQVRK